MSDIVERLHDLLTAVLTEFQRAVIIEAVDEIGRLRIALRLAIKSGTAKTELLQKAADEIERLESEVTR